MPLDLSCFAYNIPAPPVNPADLSCYLGYYIGRISPISVDKPTACSACSAGYSINNHDEEAVKRVIRDKELLGNTTHDAYDKIKSVTENFIQRNCGEITGNNTNGYWTYIGDTNVSYRY